MEHGGCPTSKKHSRKIMALLCEPKTLGRRGYASTSESVANRGGHLVTEKISCQWVPSSVRSTDVAMRREGLGSKDTKSVGKIVKTARKAMRSLHTSLSLRRQRDKWWSCCGRSRGEAALWTRDVGADRKLQDMAANSVEMVEVQAKRGPCTSSAATSGPPQVRQRGGRIEKDVLLAARPPRGQASEVNVHADCVETSS